MASPAHDRTPESTAASRHPPVPGAHLELRELTPTGVLRLHARDARAARARLAEAGFHAPEFTGERLGDDPSMLCLRPGEWLLISHRQSAEEIAATAVPALTGLVATCLDVTDGHRVFLLTGAASPWLLSKLSSLDFLAGVGGGPHAARTRLADIPVVVGYDPAGPGEPRFELVVDRSLGGYLWARLADAASHAGELYEAYGVPA